MCPLFSPHSPHPTTSLSHPTPEWNMLYQWTNIATLLSPQVHRAHFDKCIMTYTHYYSIMQNIVAAEESSVLHLFTNAQPLANIDFFFFFFYCLFTFSFPRIPYSWNHIVCRLLDWLLSLTNTQLSFIHVFCGLIVHL